MNKYKCSECDYISSKADITRHINKKNKCGLNPIINIIIEEIKCDKCDKEFSNIKSFATHIHNCIYKCIEEENKNLKEQNEKLKKRF